MSNLNGIHWVSPTLMVASLLSGIAFALAHHILYAELNGSKVNYEDYKIAGFLLSRQQVNIAAGTALAFLSKVCFIASISIAYTQLFWFIFGNKKSRLRALDTLHAALSNAWMLTRPHIWWRYPGLIFLATIAWLIPLVSIVTPSTLSISMISLTSYALTEVPQLDFASLRFINPGTINQHQEVGNDSQINRGWTMDYRGPHQFVERIAYSAAYSGLILPIQGPDTNASWVSDFAAPHLSCGPMNATIQSEVQKNLRATVSRTNPNYANRNFLAWTASEKALDDQVIGVTTSYLPFNDGSLNAGTVGPLQWGTYMEATTPGGLGFRYGWVVDGSHIPPNNTATIYFAAIPNWGYRSCDTDCFDGSTFLTCQLVNTTYHLEFNYTNGQQQIEIAIPDLESAKPVDTIQGFYFNNGTGDCSMINTSNATCVIDPVTLQKLSYQAIMDAFGQVLTGSVTLGDVSSPNGGVPSSEGTGVLATPLVYTEELYFLSSRNNWPSAADGLFTDRGGEFDSLFDWTIQKPTIPLARALEEMFQNITISLLSSSSLHPNTSSPFAPPLINISINSMEQVYTYSVKTLWLSYGLAIAFAVVAASVGMGCMWVSKAAFSEDFSTILRATRAAEMDVKFEGGDGGFCDPLPKEMAEAMVTFNFGQRSVKKVEPEAEEEAGLVIEVSEWWPKHKRWMPVAVRS